MRRQVEPEAPQFDVVASWVSGQYDRTPADHCPAQTRVHLPASARLARMPGGRVASVMRPTLLPIIERGMDWERGGVRRDHGDLFAEMIF